MKTYNLQAAVATRAAQIAAGAFKRNWRDEGRRLQDFRISDHRTAIDELSRRPEIVARAAEALKLLRNSCAEIVNEMEAEDDRRVWKS